LRSVLPEGDQTVNSVLKARLLTDWSAAGLAPIDRLLLDFAAKLTREPASISRWDIEQLQLQGLDDRAVHDVVQVTAYFNYVNRIADGLGVELEED